MTIKYSTYDSSSGNDFSLVSITGVTGVFTSEVSGTAYKASGNVTVITGSGDVRPFGLFSFPATIGSSGQCLSNNGNGTTSWNPLPTYVLTYNEYSGNSTWTKPSGASVVYVEIVGGGAGGGAGGRFATTVVRFGGGGGAAGAWLWKYFQADDLSGSVSITVGAGGSGGVSQTVNSTSGSGGQEGGESKFGEYLTSATAGGGRGGTNSGASILGGSSSFRGTNLYNGAAGGDGFAGPTILSTMGGDSSFVAAGGGGNGGTASSTATRTGVAGAVSRLFTVSGVAASIGGDAVPGEGGGGGGATYSTAVTGARGGNGAYPGGGGGGGAGSDNGFNSGKGGDGGGGTVRVWAW